MLLWIILAVVLALLFVPVSLIVSYLDGQALVFLRFCFIRFPLYPKSKPSKEHADGTAKSGSSVQQNKSRSITDRLSDLIPTLKTVLGFISNLRKQIYVKEIKVNLVLAGEDPCDLSLQYGRICALIGSIQPLVEKAFRIKNREVTLRCDYVNNTPVTEFYLHVSILAIRLIFLVLRHGTEFLKQYNSTKNQRKGGTDHESKST